MASTWNSDRPPPLVGPAVVRLTGVSTEGANPCCGCTAILSPMMGRRLPVSPRPHPGRTARSPWERRSGRRGLLSKLGSPPQRHNQASVMRGVAGRLLDTRFRKESVAHPKPFATLMIL